MNIPNYLYLRYSKIHDKLNFDYSNKGNGIDLPSNMDVDILPNQIIWIDTGICVALPLHTCAIVIGRSGLAYNHNIFCIHNGLIDNTYRGNIKVCIMNQGTQSYHVSVNDRIAQLLIIPSYQYFVQPVESLEDTIRGKDGFGSTGY
jgi:dUTP pyrophosphatase